MNSLVLTGRLLSRALWNGISSYSSVADPNVSRKREPCMLSAVCGFPKDFAKSVSLRGKFGDDAWFTAKSRTADVLGKFLPSDPPMICFDSHLSSYKFYSLNII